MTVGTPIESSFPQGFSERDMRDPGMLGATLLTLAGKAPLSITYDRHARLLARVPTWEGDGLMSNDPALHHSRTPQTHLTQTPAPGGQA